MRNAKAIQAGLNRLIGKAKGLGANPSPKSNHDVQFQNTAEGRRCQDSGGVVEEIMEVREP